eukprot:m.20314 g.20314  ORF g.20314 m.20314 type:complete len:132 (-) comp12106_c0_seq1:20-415(-)
MMLQVACNNFGQHMRCTRQRDPHVQGCEGVATTGCLVVNAIPIQTIDDRGGQICSPRCFRLSAVKNKNKDDCENKNHLDDAKTGVSVNHDTTFRSTSYSAIPNSIHSCCHQFDFNTKHVWFDQAHTPPLLG